jgi:hypothetical protein
LSRNKRKKERAAKIDTEFFQLLKHGFLRIKANFQIDDPTFDPNDIKKYKY